MRRLRAVLALGSAALAALAASPPEEQALLEAFDAALSAIAYAASGLAVFGLVWAGFLLMADGVEQRGSRARSAIALTAFGLALALSAKGLASLLSAGAIPIPVP